MKAMNRWEDRVPINYKWEDNPFIYWESLVRAFAYKYHLGQKDKQGEPYFKHLVMVAKLVEQQNPTKIENDINHKAIIVAYLHDIIEDTKITAEGLMLLGLPQEIVDAVVAMTHGKNEKYKDYILRVKKNDIARLVKMADLTHNTSLDRFLLSPETREKDLKRVAKYVWAYKYITNKITEEEFLNNF